MKYLSELKLEGCDAQKSMTSGENDNTQPLMAFVWVDPNRHYFIPATSNTQREIPYERMKWKQTAA